MTDIAGVASPESQTLARSRFGARYLPATAVVLFAVLVRVALHLNADVSWLLLLGEKILNGAVPYKDFVEVNPPASFLLYLPAVWSGHILHIAPETLVNVLAFAAAFTSLWLCGRILTNAQLLRDELAPATNALALLILLALPFYTFAEREQIALIAILPMLCIYMARAADAPCGTGSAIVAGIGGGIAVSIKFYFALALFLPFLFILWRRRLNPQDLLRATFSPENLTAGITALLYLAFVFAAFPEFNRTVLPLVLALYVPATAPLTTMLTSPSTVFWVFGASIAVLLAGRKAADPIPAVLLLASLGFIMTTIIQGKGWPYHGYPALALVLLLSGALLLQRRHEATPTTLMATLAYVAMLPLIAIWFNQSNEVKGLRDAVAQLAPVHPRIIAITDDIAIAHPLTRSVEGAWVGTTCSLWMTSYANYILAYRHPDARTTAKIKRYAALDRNWLISDIRNKQPDIILVDGKRQHDWAFSIPALRAELAGYRNARTVGGVEIWLRNRG